MVFENIKFLYCTNRQRDDMGVKKECYELKLFEVLPEQGPGKVEILRAGFRCLTKEEALERFVNIVRDALENWKKLEAEGKIPLGPATDEVEEN